MSVICIARTVGIINIDPYTPSAIACRTAYPLSLTLPDSYGGTLEVMDMA
jgi:hypothetical protein